MTRRIGQRMVVGFHSTIGALPRRFRFEPEPVNASQLYKEAAFGQFFPLLDVTGTTDFVEIWFSIFRARQGPVVLLRGKWLNHTKNPISTERVFYHGAITGLEDMQ